MRAEGSGLGSTLKHRNTQTRILGFGLQNSVATYSLHCSSFEDILQEPKYVIGYAQKGTTMETIGRVWVCTVLSPPSLTGGCVGGLTVFFEPLAQILDLNPKHP